MDQLKAKVIVAVTAATKRFPAIGWVRADQVPSDATVREILVLKDRIQNLEAEAAARSTDLPPGSEDLARGDDTYTFTVGFVGRKPDDTHPYKRDKRYRIEIEPTWNSVFAAVAPSMMQETKDRALREGIGAFLVGQARQEVDRDDDDLKGRRLTQFEARAGEVETCVVQLRALGLIEESDRKRSIKDVAQYWQLTPYGHTLMVQLRAIRRVPLQTHLQTTSATPVD